MSGADARPDPDALLKRVQSEAARESRAQLKIFFGFAPGVGKTYAMLESARRLRDEGVDVVVGAVDTHGREETKALLEGLEILPPRQVPYRDKILEEFDLDAALARRPAILLLDEVAHTNAPGSRHRKRWQDAVELLDQKISVHTTLNVQHVESLNDVVAQITTVKVRETVPDTLLERADELELVDLSPEDLMKRLEEGKVYVPEQATLALQHFFKRGNLLALRELALRRTAERVDADVQAYREETGVETTWPTSDRILVCVGPAPSSGRLVRAARRTSAGLRAPWVAVYVETPGIRPLSTEDRERLEAHLSLAESLGGTVVRLTGPDISGPLLAYARRNNVARIIVGKPSRARWRDWPRGSVIDALVRGSGDIDVNVISGDEAAEEKPRERTEAPREPVSWPSYGWAVALVVLTSAVAAPADRVFSIPDIEMLYLIAVMITAIRFGRGPSLLAAALSVAAYDFLFVPPHFTFTVADARYFLSFAMMFAVGLILSTLVLRIRRQQADAIQREERTASLYAFSRSLGGAIDRREVAQVSADQIAAALRSEVLILLREEDLTLVATSPPGVAIDASDFAVARWVYDNGRKAGLGTDSLPGAKRLCVPLSTSGPPIGVLALRSLDAQPLSADQRAFLDAFCRQAAFAVERAAFAEQARQAALRANTEEMRSALLSAVSHDLRTPIATITGAGTTLRDEPNLSPALEREMIETVCEEAERLERLVSNLLDMTRLESGELRLERDWVPLLEIVGGARRRLRTQLSSHRVITSVPEDLPLIRVDPVLMEQLFVNLLENAAKYTPAESTIEIWATVDPSSTIIEVRDEGDGIAVGEEERIFERFYRGARTAVPGVGLGLSICRAIARAHDGTLTAATRSTGGAAFRLTLPRPEERPS